MLKEEFEARIGKEVSFDTFQVYEKMYNSLPESYNKDDFVRMLNISNIPESEEAIQRREEAEAIRERWREHITALGIQIIKTKEDIKRYAEYAKMDVETAAYWKKDIISTRRYLKRLEAEKKEYKNLLR